MKYIDNLVNQNDYYGLLNEEKHIKEIADFYENKISEIMNSKNECRNKLIHLIKCKEEHIVLLEYIKKCKEKILTNLE
jgi:hypothetical protein